jgi:hypothetical protein
MIDHFDLAGYFGSAHSDIDQHDISILRHGRVILHFREIEIGIVEVLESILNWINKIQTEIHRKVNQNKNYQRSAK